MASLSNSENENPALERNDNESTLRFRALNFLKNIIRHPFRLSLLLSIIFYILDSFIDHLYFYENSFLDSLLFEVPPHELYMRLTVMLFLFMFGFVTSKYLNIRKKSEEDLRKTESLLRSLIDNLEQKVFLKDRNSVYIFCNDKYARDMKIKASEIVGKTDYELYPDELAEKYRSDDNRIMETGISEALDEEYIQDGQKTTIHTVKTPIKDDKGSVVGVLGIFWDIALQKQNEKEQLNRTRQLETLSNATRKLNEVLEIPIIMHNLVSLAMRITGAEQGAAGIYDEEKMKFFEFNKDGKTSPVDYEFEKGFGVPGHVIETRKPYISYDAKNDPLVIQEIQQSFNFRNLIDVPVINRKGDLLGCIEIHNKLDNKDFDDFDIELLSGLADSAATAIDNTKTLEKQKEVEVALQESRERFKQVTEQSPSVYELYDLDGLQIEVNKAYEELWSFPRETTVGIFNVLKSKEVVDTGLIEFVNKAYSGEIVKLPPYSFNPTGETESRGFGRIRWLSTRIYPLKDIHGKVTHIVITHEDISDYKYAEEERKKLEEQLMQAQKIESIGRLAGGIAHDFNNILTSILGNAELLKLRFDESDSYETEATDIIIKGAERAAGLTKQLLGFARGGKYNPVALNINDNITESIRVSEKIFEKNIALVYDFANDINAVEADKHQLLQVITNLIINAKDAMPDGGNLTFKTENITIDEEYLKGIQDVEPGEFVKISITDTGVGMDNETKSRVFEPFFTTKSEGKGTGLGLAMVYGIVKNHGGFVDIISESGEGTTIILYFPVTDKEVEEVIIDTEILSGDANILVVDDEENVRNYVGEMLSNLGYNVLLSKNGKEAVDLYKEKMDEIDLVLLDIIMPEMAGRETNLELRKLNPEVKILLSSGFSQDVKANEILKEGALGFLQKPFTARELSKAIAESLSKTVIT